MNKDVPSLNLRKYDRMVPTIVVSNVAMFETISVPFVVIFWRMCKQDRVFHECPLLTGILGVSYDSWYLDGLHTWALGPVSALVHLILVFCVRSRVFGPLSKTLDKDDIDRLAVLHIKSLLMDYYKRRSKDTDWKRTGTKVMPVSHAACHMAVSYLFHQ